MDHGGVAVRVVELRADRPVVERDDAGAAAAAPSREGDELGRRRRVVGARGVPVRDSSAATAADEGDDGDEDEEDGDDEDGGDDGDGQPDGCSDPSDPAVDTSLPRC